MRKKLCLTLCVLTLSVVLTACGGTETETTQAESTTEEIVVETTEEVTEESVEETTEEVEVPTVEAKYNYTEDVALQVSQDMYMVDGITSIDVKTITDFTIAPSADTDMETGEPAYYMYQAADGTTLKFDVVAMHNIGTETSTYTNADGVEIIYESLEFHEFLYVPLNEYEEGMSIRIGIKPVDKENFNIEDYLEITRKCYYIIHEEE